MQGEPGADRVEAELFAGGACSSVNWSETAQKLVAHEHDWEMARGLLFSYDLKVLPVLREDGELAARLWTRGSGLSLADRLCLAMGQRLDATVWTADTAWGSTDTIHQVR